MADPTLTSMFIAPQQQQANAAGFLGASLNFAVEPTAARASALLAAAPVERQHDIKKHCAKNGVNVGAGSSSSFKAGM